MGVKLVLVQLSAPANESEARERYAQQSQGTRLRNLRDSLHRVEIAMRDCSILKVWASRTCQRAPLNGTSKEHRRDDDAALSIEEVFGQ